MTDTTLAALNGLIDQRDAAAAYAPKDEREQVVVPELERYRDAGAGNTDRVLADGFFRHYRHLFVNGNGVLHIYHANRGEWSSQNVDKQVFAYCMHLSDRFHDELADAREQRAQAQAANDAEADNRLAARMTALVKLIAYCERANTVGNVARMVNAKLIALTVLNPVEMNPGLDVLACTNGVVDLRTGELRHPRAADYLTRNTGVTYKHDVDYSWWSNVVNEITGHNPRLSEFIQVWYGYCATGYTREHCMGIFHGIGRNGKNLIMDAVASALGGYAKALPSSFLEAMGSQSAADNSMMTAMADLEGIRLAYVSETGERSRLRESWVKSQTGDRTISARKLYENHRQFRVQHKLSVGTNHKPEIAGTDEGVWSRIRLIPMLQVFASQDMVDAGVATAVIDKTLLDRATTAEGREAVLKWVVDGATKYLTNGLDRYTPPEVSAETQMYRREQDVLGQFLQLTTSFVPKAEVERVMALEAQPRAFGKLDMDERLRVEKLEFWRVYTVWCEENGHKPYSSTAFSRRITSAQRFWQDDIGSELLMKPLAVAKTMSSYFYRYVRLSDEGVRLRNIARSRIQSRERAQRDEGFEG